MPFNSEQIMDALDALKAMKTNDKQAALAIYLKDPMFQRVVKAAYCPFTTYGIGTLPKLLKALEPSSDATFDINSVFVWETFDLLATRKLTGNDAQMCIEGLAMTLSRRSYELLGRILLKDLRAGFTANSVNKAMPGLISTFECMLAHKYEEKRVTWPVAVEPKYDGVRALCIIKEDQVQFLSRTGKEFQGMDDIVAAVMKNIASLRITSDLVIDGELISSQGFHEIVGAVHRHGEKAADAAFMAFDVMLEEEFKEGRSFGSYADRRSALVWAVNIIDSPLVQITPMYKASSNAEVEYYYQAIRDQGGEGVIVKNLTARYECKRSYGWLKIKDRQTVDIPIIGFEEGTGKNEGRLGALVCNFNGVVVKVGGGLTDADRDGIWQNKESFLDVLAEVEYHETTPDGSLRHPRFIRLREDKPIEDGVGV